MLYPRNILQYPELRGYFLVIVLKQPGQLSAHLNRLHPKVTLNLKSHSVCLPYR